MYGQFFTVEVYALLKTLEKRQQLPTSNKDLAAFSALPLSVAC